MPRGRSTFSKRQKEQSRQQRRIDKAARRIEKKQERPGDDVHELEELRQNAEAQAALFDVGRDSSD